MSKIKEYTNGEVTIVWEAEKCIHSAKCVNGLPSVFNPDARPWITPEDASSEDIVAQVKVCPSGALKYYWNDGRKEDEATNDELTKVEVLPKGPLMVHGELEVTLPDGTIKRMNKISAFCRCGASQNKPLCDGSHSKVDFED
ncbi:(4Fe-4S)-binding protein [Sediminitomix flava]|uniref:Putative Fe-S cluster protein YjdI n=1 Tax=Sediminitomix flava TaxID=379075 RepID=A0A315ZHM1_SEDFL|nr:(4Fe-4S)-binding protein [Sediminitomix flava]PWJ44699.1 putative Fe-S cluster protein YjdI [Sediminitomix flava]